MAQRKVTVGKISGNRGHINIATGNIIENIQHIYERSLTSAEGKAKARSIEYKLLAQGTSSFLKRMRHAVEIPALRSPCKGLLYYELADAGLFFGRKHDIQELLSVMDRGAFTILYSESGAGKTSLLQAGIVPRLIACGDLPIYLRSNSKNPALAIKQIFTPDLTQVPNLTRSPLVDFLQHVSEIIGSKTTLYLFLDQFEEFFTKTTELDQKTFIEELADCLDNNSLNVHWLISIRKEYFGYLELFGTRIRNPYENYYYLNKLTRDQACEVITKSAKKSGLSFEDGLIDVILDDLGKDSICPPELQLVFAALHEESSVAQNHLTFGLYEKEGGTTGILNNHLKRVLSRDISPVRRVIARQVLESLVTSVPQRATRSHQELINRLANKKIPPEDVDIILDQLVNSRLIRADETEEGLKYELVHDYLLEEIKLDQPTRQRKQAEELLQQGTENWKKHGVLLGRDAIELIDRERKQLKPSSDEAQLFILSAIEQKINPKPWKAFLEKEARLKIIEDSAKRLNEKDKRVRQHANTLLWFFASDQPETLRRQYIPKEIARRGIVNVLPWLSKYLFVIISTILLLFVLTLASSVGIGGWRLVSTLNSQCLSGNKPGLLDVSIDPNNHSKFVVYDRTNNQLCQSTDAGRSWDTLELPSTNAIGNIEAGNNKIFVISSNKIYYKELGHAPWRPLEPSPSLNGEYIALRVNPRNRDELMIASSENELVVLRNSEEEQTSTKINTDPISGQVTGMATDGAKIVIATTEGIWHSDYPKTTWYRVSNTETQQHIHSIVIFEDFFYVVTDDKRISTGDFYREAMLSHLGQGESSLPSWPDTQNAVESLAVTESVVLVGNSSGLKCYPDWNWFQSEWWRLVFFKSKPCQ